MKIAEDLITILLYLGIFLGAGLVFHEDILRFLKRLQMRRRLLQRRRAEEESPLLRHLGQTLQSASNRSIPPQAFLGVLGLLFGLVFAISANTLSLPLAGAAAGLAAALPYLLLRIRVENLRRRGSHEGEVLVAEFLRQYRISGFNVFETLEKVVHTGENIRISRRFLFKLLLELRDTGDPRKIQAAAENFSYGINTNWSRMLAHNIRVAAEKGTNVSLAVEDILIQLREARVLNEERRRLNSESTRMTLFLVPAMYLVTVFLAVRYLEVPLMKFLRNQFYTPEGLLFFLLILFLFVGNLALMAAVNNRRFDF